MSDELKKFIEEQFEILRKEITEAFKAARLRIEAAEAAAKLDKQHKSVDGAKNSSDA